MRKRCVYCKKLFTPDPRQKGNQKTCGSKECQQARRRENTGLWRKQNPDYDTSDYRKLRHRDRKSWKKTYWSTHPEYRNHHAEYMRQWRGMKKIPDTRVRVPYRDIELAYCKQKTFIKITGVRPVSRDCIQVIEYT